MSLPCKFDHPGTARRPAAAVLAPVPVRGLRLGANLGRVPAMPLGLHRDDARLHVKGGREAGAARLRERGDVRVHVIMTNPSVSCDVCDFAAACLPFGRMVALARIKGTK